MPNVTPSEESAALTRANGGTATTAAQREAAFGQTTQAPTFGFGIVKGCSDSEKGGQLMVLADIFGPLAVPCAYVSPVGGGGAGFFALPGIGATVLCANIPSTNPPVQNVWMGCLYPEGSVIPESYVTQPYSKTEREVSKFYTPEITPPRGKPTQLAVGAGVPNQDVIYLDNNLPNSYVFQHPAGHSFRMTKKVTRHRNQNEIVVRSAMGKRLVLSDAPADKGGNSLQLLDENDNGLSIYTQSTAPTVKIETDGDIVQKTRVGDITSTISADAKDASIESTNAGINSHIGVSSIGDSGTLNLTASKEIILQVGGSQIIMTENAITINATKLNITGGDGSDITLAKVPFVDHTHGVTVNIPDSTLNTIAVTTTGIGTASIDGPAMKTGLPATTVASTGTVLSTTGGLTTQEITSKPITSTGSSEPLYLP